MPLPKFIAPGFNGGKFDHVTISIREFATMLKTPEGLKSLNPGGQLSSRFEKAHKTLKANPVIPQDVRDEADRYSRELVWSLSTFRSKVIRGQSHGALDSSRLARLASPGLAPREFERLAQSAYRRREHVQAVTTRPRIAIVADANNEIRTSNLGYMKMLGRLAYIVGEAAKLSGVEVLMIGSRGFRNTYSIDPAARALATVAGCPSGNRETRPHVGTVLKDWNDDVTGAEYALFTDTYAFSTLIWGTLHLCTSNRDGMESNCGAGGIEFARAQGANLVIAFGNFDASETPDIRFNPSDSVEAVVRGIVAALGNREAA